jgi:hypothetical protein
MAFADGRAIRVWQCRNLGSKDVVLGECDPTRAHPAAPKYFENQENRIVFCGQMANNETKSSSKLA